MPPRKKEERRRGKKRKAGDKAVEGKDDAAPFYEDRDGAKEPDQGNASTPSWLIEDNAASTSRIPAESSTPFGLVDLELKAYIRSAHLKLNELMETAIEESRTISQDEEVKTLRNAMLDEIKGKELTLATDSDTSRILENMLHSFSERQTRILADSLTGSSEDLFKLSCHRFGSHLLQSTLLALQSAASQEELQKLGEVKKKGKVFSGDGKELRSAQDLILDISKELHQHTSALLPDQFGTHVLRTLLIVLSGQASKATTQAQRSKKSRSYQEKTQSSRAIKEEQISSPVVPSSFGESLTMILESIKGDMEENQMKALSTDVVAGPTLALLVELSLWLTSNEVAKGTGSDSLLTVILDGLVATDSPHRSDYLESLMKDSVGSHMLQRLLRMLDDEVIGRFWQVYIEGNLCKLGVHPIANFVVAAVVRRLGEQDNAFGQACEEVELAGEALVKNAKLGILIALADRSLELSQLQPIVEVAPNEVRNYRKRERNVWVDGDAQSKTARAILSAFGFSGQYSKDEGKEGDQGLLVRVIASGKTRKSYKKETKRMREKAKEAATVEKPADESGDGNMEQIEDPSQEELQISMQGSLLCQALLRLPEPGNTPLLNSLLALPSLLPLSADPVGVHIILAPFRDNARTSFAQKTTLSTKILSELSPMLSDKFASRVIDCFFDKSDAFFKEKIMRKCIEEENAILTTNFGRYFLKRVNISLFRKDVASWKRQMKERKVISEQQQKEEVPAVKQKAERPAKKAKVDQELDLILAGI